MPNPSFGTPQGGSPGGTTPGTTPVTVPAGWNPFTSFQKNLGKVKSGVVNTLGGTVGPPPNPVYEQKKAILATQPTVNRVNIGDGSPSGAAPVGDYSIQNPGYGEQAWNAAGQWFFGPTAMSGFVPQAQEMLGGPSASEQYWNSIQGNLNAPTASQGYFDLFKANRPDVGLDAGLDPFYDRARQKTQEAIDTAFAARGGYGSSAATNTISDAMQGLGAEQANREADYRLRALAENRAYDALGGSLAQGADITKQGLLGLGTGAAGAATSGALGRAGALGNIIAGADAGELGKRIAGHGAATNAQSSREGRINSALGAVQGSGAMQAGAAQDAFMNLIAGDERLLDAYLSMVMGIPTEQLGQNRYASQRTAGDVGAFASALASLYGGGILGGAAGGAGGAGAAAAAG